MTEQATSHETASSPELLGQGDEARQFRLLTGQTEGTAKLEDEQRGLIGKIGSEGAKAIDQDVQERYAKKS
ncbi:MAG: hypothetical protein AAB553_03685 [Patescibacteria group bacterium]